MTKQLTSRNRRVNYLAEVPHHLRAKVGRFGNKQKKGLAKFNAKADRLRAQAQGLPDGPEKKKTLKKVAGVERTAAQRALEAQNPYEAYKARQQFLEDREMRRAMMNPEEVRANKRQSKAQRKRDRQRQAAKVTDSTEVAISFDQSADDKIKVEDSDEDNEDDDVEDNEEEDEVSSEEEWEKHLP